MKRGSLIIYDNEGKIFLNTGDADDGGCEGLLQHTYPVGLPYIETKFGELSGKRVLGVDVSVTPHKLIIEDIPKELTPEELKIQELENELLVASGVI